MRLPGELAHQTEKRAHFSDKSDAQTNNEGGSADADLTPAALGPESLICETVRRAFFAGRYSALSRP